MKITPIAMEAIGVFCYIKRDTRKTIYTLLWQYMENKLLRDFMQFVGRK